MTNTEPKIIVHGGASPKKRTDPKRREVVEQAAEAGYKVLREGGNAKDAVCSTVSILEDDPLFNAGTGSYVQMDGTCRMDACLMDSNLNVGAVIQVEQVRNPILVARRLLDLGIHSILMGTLATEFARAEGFESYDTRTDAKLKIWIEQRHRFAKVRRVEFLKLLRDQIKGEAMLGTVGAVALDRRGRLAAGTSTGGLAVDLPGRVGDVPLVGCGTYANAAAGVSCTGIGEKIIRVVLAKTATDLIEQGVDAQAACETALKRMDAIGGWAGLIAIDLRGNLGAAFNTGSMAHASRG
ncbi:MAG: isoaspartyl peptidase/L-asparaginase [Candidatus Alcyoniella australis]|nr:isoaspartyl peptidase/L-asparaginase [Candidatus Alcyoniella australis]